MKKFASFLAFAIILSVVLSLFPFSVAQYSSFPDLDGHWAEDTLRMALSDGLIVGDRGLLYPDRQITTAEILEILCRVADARMTADISGFGISTDAWYYESVAKSVYLGLISPADSIDFNAPATRQDAFYLLAEAFQLTETSPDLAVLEQFSDSWQIRETRRQALASLISQGIVGGDDGRLFGNRNSTRAEFLSVMYRIIGKNDFSPGEVLESSALDGIRIEVPSERPNSQQDIQHVLDKVTSGYLGDFTLEWALANDLADNEKEIWINANGYSSSTEYLLWINLTYQRVNIFQGSAGNWDLIRTCIVGTGAPGMGTPRGVWTTSRKQTQGWTTRTYTVRPVVRFRGDSGYAFHSRLYFPNSDILQDDSIGFPISRGCIRMYDEDIMFLYDFIPNGTTVVVF